MTLNPKLGGSCSGRTTTTLATLKGATGETRKLYVLLDNGSSNSILSDKYLFYVISVNKSKSHQATSGGPYKTSEQSTTTFNFAGFSSPKAISWQIDPDKGRLERLGYDMITGRDLLQALKIIIFFEYQVIKWEDTNILLNEFKLSNERKKELDAIFGQPLNPK